MNLKKTDKKLVIGITAPGSVTLIEGQLSYFSKLGYTTYLLAPNHERTQLFCEKEGCEFLPVSIEREISIFQDLLSLFVILRHLIRVKPDIVNVGTPKMGLLGILAAWITGVEKRIYTCRGFRFEHESGLKRKLLIGMERLTAYLAHEVICISKSVKQLGIDYSIFSEEKSIVIGQGSSNGIPLDRFDPGRVDSAAMERLKRELGLDGCFVFGFVGRLIDRKGINELYNAFIDLYKENDRLRLLFVGPSENSQISDKGLLRRMEEHPAVTLVGSQRNVPLYLSIMDVFVLPAWWEGFGNVLVQAAAMGVAVISTTGTGSRDAVKDQYNGILISPKSKEELKQVMRLLLEDEPLREKLGNNGITWAKSFDSQLVWSGMKKLYEKEGV